ncbi:hypothetical protein ACFRFQ_01615 [Rhodococcus sp. NPDC056743]|uniref:hypothetical protein n=1 Tax=Rhodococcus sp. NPDC056743 TaxID=3345934 RepID=UPI003670D715
MWWIVVGGLILWVVCAVPIAILWGKAISRRDRADFEIRNQQWADEVARSIEAETDSETEK